MSSAAVPFKTLAQRIAEQEAELAKLRQELMSRQDTLTELTRHKEELQAELEQVEAEIESVGQVNMSGLTASAAATKPSVGRPKGVPQGTKPAPAKPASSTPQATTKKPAPGRPRGTGRKQTLHDALMEVLAESPHPLSASELAERLVANGYKSRSKDLKNVIWVGIGKMPDIERIAGQGYRLKKRKG